uniref:28S ribosomal protein S14, mitochondrial n=1 Tax=Arion vulgaris TaxID=1028688 RepID=A0A0B7BWM1_9EUPU
MFGLLSRVVSSSASQFNHLSASLLQLTTTRVNGSAITSCVNSDVPKRSKYWAHHFLNRWMARDYKRRCLVNEYYPLRQRLIAIKRCSVLPKELQEVTAQELHELPRDSCFTRLKPRCILTSRPRWVIHRYRLSRIQWRLLADYNKMSGVLRASW